MPRSSTTWQPGQSGNPGGRPKRALTEILARAGSASGAKPEQLFRFLMRTRRNLTDDQRAMLADQERELLVQQSLHERVSNVTPVEAASASTGSEGCERTRTTVARSAGVSEWKLRQAKTVRERVANIAPVLMDPIKEGRNARADAAGRAGVSEYKVQQAKTVRDKRPDLARRVVSLREYVRGIGKGGS